MGWELGHWYGWSRNVETTTVGRSREVGSSPKVKSREVGRNKVGNKAISWSI